MSSTWSPSQYLKFEDHRTRPVVDLLARVVGDNPEFVTDMGCGPGNSTELLVDRFSTSAVAGMDLSPAMIEAARKRLPGCAFEIDDVARSQPKAPQDVLFANAVLQWVRRSQAARLRDRSRALKQMNFSGSAGHPPAV